MPTKTSTTERNPTRKVDIVHFCFLCGRCAEIRESYPEPDSCIGFCQTHHLLFRKLCNALEDADPAHFALLVLTLPKPHEFEDLEVALASDVYGSNAAWKELTDLICLRI